MLLNHAEARTLARMLSRVSSEENLSSLNSARNRTLTSAVRNQAIHQRQISSFRRNGADGRL